MVYNFFYRTGCCDCVKSTRFTSFPEFLCTFTQCRDIRTNRCCRRFRCNFNNFNTFDNFDNDFDFFDQIKFILDGQKINNVSLFFNETITLIFLIKNLFLKQKNSINLLNLALR